MTVTALPAAILAEASLVAYWPMDDAAIGVARDRGPTGYPGSYNANCQLGVLGLDGLAGGAVKFGEPKNLGSVMNVPTNAAFLHTSGSAEFCIRFNRFDNINTVDVFYAHDTGPQIRIMPVGGNPGFQLRKQGIAAMNTSVSTPITDTYLWHHVIVTWTPTNTHIWIDGADTAGVDTAETMVYGAATPLHWAGSFVQAAMAHCAYYGAVLSPTAVATHYAAFQADVKWPTSKSLQFGLVTNLPQEASSTTRQAQIQNVVQAHGSAMYFDLNWNTIQPTNGAYDWSLWDAIFSQCQAGGITTVALAVNRSPTWVNGGANAQFVPGANATDAAFTTWIAAYQTFITDAVNRYKAGGVGNPYGLSVIWEIWDEPNTKNFWGSAGNPNGTMYGTFYKAMYTSIKAADSTAKVALGSLTAWYDVGVNDTLGLQFAKDTLSVAGLTVDYASFHPYVDLNGSPDSVPINSNLFSDLLTYYDTLCSYGHSSAKVLVTEMGWDTGVVSTANQAAYLTTGLTRIRDYWSGFVSLVCVYRDWNTGSTGGFALFSDMPALPGVPTPKPSAQSFYKVAAPFAREERVGRVLI